MSRRVAKRFLERVWEAQPQTPGYVFLSVKDWSDGSWEDCPYPYPLESLRLPTLKDLYFAPCIFGTDRRKKDQALPGRWLYADLDEVDPRSLDLEPTIAWETSPGRYQALWQLQRALRPEQLQLLNQKLTYATGADRGGWSLTKVLRVPGSISTKRESDYVVQNLWTDGPVYIAGDLYHRVRDVDTPQTASGKLPSLKLPKASAAKLRRRHRSRLSVTARRLLEASEATQGTRSERLWKLERLLVEAGIPAEHVFVMVKATVWNKYRGQQREDQQLWREIQQAVRSSGPSKTKSSSGSASSAPERSEKSQSSSSSSEDREKLQPVVLSDFVAKRVHRPLWMVEGIWSESAHGLIAGMPKTYKSVLATDLAISVASGTKFLGRFEVPQIGPVLMIQRENDEGLVQDRVLRILNSRGLGEHAELNGDRELHYRPPADLPLHFINNADINLADEDDMQLIADLVAKVRPILLILDPLYLLADVDENSAHQMAPILRELLRVKQKYNCGTLLIHHFHKPPTDDNSARKGATRISGTGAFHRWYESVVLLERPDYEEPTIRVSTEHRGQSPTPGFLVRFDLGTADDLYYDVEIEAVGKEKTKQQHARIHKILENKDGYVQVQAIADELQVSIDVAKRRLVAEGLSVHRKKIKGKSVLVVKGE